MRVLEVNEDELRRKAKHPMESKGKCITAEEIAAWIEERRKRTDHAVEVIEEIGPDVVIDALKAMGIVHEPRAWEGTEE